MGQNLRTLVLQVICTVGLFANLWYLGSAALYFLVYGDNSSRFGWYPVVPAAIAAVSVVWALRKSTVKLYALAALTAPLAILFAYNCLRFGLF